MKNTTWISALVLLTLTGFANAQNLSGSSLNIGDSSNVLADYSAAFGTGNTLIDSEENHAYDSIYMGEGNYGGFPRTLVIGTNNYSGSGSEGNYISGSDLIILGSWNGGSAQQSIIVGTNNMFYVDPNQYQLPKNSALIGRGLFSNDDNCLIVGKFNNPVSGAPGGGVPRPLFVVANGSSATLRSDAFKILDNGDVVLGKPQGDISMGIFGN